MIQSKATFNVALPLIHPNRVTPAQDQIAAQAYP